MGEHGAVGEEEGIEGMGAVDHDRDRAVNDDVLAIVAGVGFGDGGVAGEVGGRSRGNHETHERGHKPEATPHLGPLPGRGGEGKHCRKRTKRSQRERSGWFFEVFGFFADIPVRFGHFGFHTS